MTVEEATAKMKVYLRQGDIPAANRLVKVFKKKSPYPVPEKWRDWVRFTYYLAVQGDKRT